jgi:acylphosphatase
MAGGLDDPKRVHILVSGWVQGVFFRSETCKMAEKLGVVGWVRNTRDGRVEIVAEGEREKLEEFITWCKKGPFLARVENVKIDWQSSTGEFLDFEVLY